MKVTKKTVASKYKQGSGYIVSYYSMMYDSFVTSGEVPHWKACSLVRECREHWDTRKQEYIY
jgi:hypothetical protein